MSREKTEQTAKSAGRRPAWTCSALARELYEVGKKSAEVADKANILRKVKWSELNEIQRAGWLGVARHVLDRIKSPTIK